MATARELHGRVAPLYALLNAERYFLRAASEGKLAKQMFAYKATSIAIEHDRVVCGLANKAANTHKAIGVLCDAELADDSYALCRVLMENAVVFCWLCRGDWPDRIERYVMSRAPNQKRLAEVIQDHVPGTSDAIEAAESWSRRPTLVAVSDALNDEYLKWAVFPDPARPGKLKTYSLKDMLAEMDDGKVQPKSGHFAYALQYFDTSQFVHSTPTGLRNIETETHGERTYHVAERARRELRDLALVTSSVWMLVTLASLADFLGHHKLREQVDELVEAVKGYDREHAAGTSEAVPV